MNETDREKNALRRDVKFWQEYARILRAVYLNPSDHALSIERGIFEREHDEKLSPHWKKWQRKADER